MKTVSIDICKVKADVIVNAANGIGFMGGILGRYIPLRGVAESINFATKGKVEKEAKKAAKKHRWLPRILCGHHAGEVYVTGAGGLPSSWIIHAVTMRYPGMRSDIHIIEILLGKIIEKARKLNAKTLAIPLLGSGTGGIHPKEVFNLYEDLLSRVEDIEIIVVLF